MKKNRIHVNALPKKTMQYIEAKTRGTSLHAGLSFQDEEDLKQFICLNVIKARESSAKNNKASLETYLHGAVDRAAKMFLRGLRTKKRINIVVTLDAPLEDRDGSQEDDVPETMLDTVADPDGDGAGIARTDLRNDVAEAVHRMDPVSRELCRHLMAGLSIRGAAKEMGIPFWTLTRKHVPRIAECLKEVLAS